MNFNYKNKIFIGLTIIILLAAIAVFSLNNSASAHSENVTSATSDEDYYNGCHGDLSQEEFMAFHEEMWDLMEKYDMSPESMIENEALNTQMMEPENESFITRFFGRDVTGGMGMMGGMGGMMMH